jgi:hypothetical protein
VPRHGIYLYEAEARRTYGLGDLDLDDALSPADQERLCRGLGHKHWIVLLGLDSPADDD